MNDRRIDLMDGSKRAFTIILSDFNQDEEPTHVAVEFEEIEGRRWVLMERAGTANLLIVTAMAGCPKAVLKFVQRNWSNDMDGDHWFDDAFHGFYEGRYQPRRVR